MGAKKKYNKLSENIEKSGKNEYTEQKYVNLLPVYTIYKQKFRRVTKEEFDQLLGRGKSGKAAALKLCKEFMKAKNIPEDVNFETNKGFLSFPRFLPMVALLAERSEYKIVPNLVKKVDVRHTPKRFKEKFCYLMTYGFWYLGRVICDSLSVKEQVNRGNMFNFTKGDLGYWWAGVRILDWNMHICNERARISCQEFLILDPPKYRFYSSRAISNMGQHQLYFLSEDDWNSFNTTVKSVRHPKVPNLHNDWLSISSDSSKPCSSSFSSESDVSSLSDLLCDGYESFGSKESID